MGAYRNILIITKMNFLLEHDIIYDIRINTEGGKRRA